jgi:hypothetical protein
MKPPLALIADPPFVRVVESLNGMVIACALQARADYIGPGFLRDGKLFERRIRYQRHSGV